MSQCTLLQSKNIHAGEIHELGIIYCTLAFVSRKHINLHFPLYFMRDLEILAQAADMFYMPLARYLLSEFREFQGYGLNFPNALFAILHASFASKSIYST